MATTAPVNFDIDYLRAPVIAAYDQVVPESNARYHFHPGADYARDFLGKDTSTEAKVAKDLLVQWVRIRTRKSAYANVIRKGFVF
jgi:hypothetical protein